MTTLWRWLRRRFVYIEGPVEVGLVHVYWLDWWGLKHTLRRPRFYPWLATLRGIPHPQDQLIWLRRFLQRIIRERWHDVTLTFVGPPKQPGRFSVPLPRWVWEPLLDRVEEALSKDHPPQALPPVDQGPYR